jgi:glycosyltransferase involved in cell wall biosynthesis
MASNAENRSTMKLSVLIVAYNQERFIRQTVESALMQRTDFDYEIVIGEDCSTDGTRAVLEQLAHEHPGRLRLLLRDRNVGMHANFANALSACVGEYVATLEGDDYWTDPQKLQKQVDFLVAHPECSFSCHAVEWVFDDGSEPPRRFPEGVKAISAIEDLLQGNNFIQTCSLVFRRCLFPSYPDWFFSLALGDWPMCCVLAQYGKIGFVDEVMAIYRIHQGGVWSTTSDVYRFPKVLDMYEELRKHLKPQYFPIITLTLARWYAIFAQRLAIDGDRQRAKTQVARSVGCLLEADAPRNCDVQHVIEGIMSVTADLTNGTKTLFEVSRDLEVTRRELAAVRASHWWRLKEKLVSVPGVGVVANRFARPVVVESDASVARQPDVQGEQT